METPLPIHWHPSWCRKCLGDPSPRHLTDDVLEQLMWKARNKYVKLKEELWWERYCAATMRRTKEVHESTASDRREKKERFAADVRDPYSQEGRHVSFQSVSKELGEIKQGLKKVQLNQAFLLQKLTTQSVEQAIQTCEHMLDGQQGNLCQKDYIKCQKERNHPRGMPKQTVGTVVKESCPSPSIQRMTKEKKMKQKLLEKKLKQIGKSNMDGNRISEKWPSLPVDSQERELLLRKVLERIQWIEGEEESTQLQWKALLSSNRFTTKYEWGIPNQELPSYVEPPSMEEISPHTPCKQKQVAVLSLSSRSLGSIRANKKRFEDHLHKTNTYATDQFDPWKTTERIADKLVSDVIQGMASELEEIHDHFVQRILKEEFNK